LKYEAIYDQLISACLYRKLVCSHVNKRKQRFTKNNS